MSEDRTVLGSQISGQHIPASERLRQEDFTGPTLWIIAVRGSAYIWIDGIASDQPPSRQDLGQLVAGEHLRRGHEMRFATVELRRQAICPCRGQYRRRRFTDLAGLERGHTSRACPPTVAHAAGDDERR